MQFLKADTNTEVLIGPVVSVSDGYTPVTTLSLSTADEAEIIKYNGASALTVTSISANTMTPITGADGYYTLDLSTSNLDTEGFLTVLINDDSLCLPIRVDFQVVNANVYDSLFAVAATDYLQTDIQQVGGVTEDIATETKQDIAQADLDTITGTDGVTLATSQANYAPLKPTTAGRTLDVTATGAAGIDWGNVENQGTSVDLSATAMNLVDTATTVTNQVTADATAINGDATAAANLEAMYNGTGYLDDTAPASRAQVGVLSSVSGGISTTAESFTKSSTEPETNTYTATAQDDGTYHLVEDVAGTTDVYYQFDIGGSGKPQSIDWNGYAQLNGDSYGVYSYNWGGTAWEQIGTIAGANGTTEVNAQWILTTAHVGTGANLGKVRLRFYSTDGTGIATDRILCSYAVVPQSVGYADGAIWVDTNASNTNTEDYVDGVADNPVSTWAAALTLSSSLGITRFHIKGGSSITLTGNSDNYELIGDGLYNLALGSQSLADAHVIMASVTGTSSGTGTVWERCRFNNSVSVGAGYFDRCGVAAASGTPMTANGAGEYVFADCLSLVAGSGTPYMDFSGTGGSSGVNIRRWAGGTNITLDSNNSLSLEVAQGGGQTITTGGANVEVRGTCRSLTVTMSSTETVQFAGITGVITLSGTTTGTVNLYGVSSSVSDSTSGATVTDATVSRTDVEAILTDTAEIGVAGAGLTNINLPDQTMNITGNITGNLSGSIGSLGATAKTDVNAEADTALADFFTSKASLVDDIWDEDIVAAHNTADTAGAILNNILPEKNAALNNIPFLFVAASDHVTPVTGASGTAVTRSIDGGAFGSGTGTLSEVGNGIYQYDASAADMNGEFITFRFTATGGTPGAPDDCFVTVKTTN